MVWFAIVTQPRAVDSKFARDAWLRALGKTATIGDRGETLPVLIDRLAGEFDAAPALLSVETSMTYRQLAHRANQYSRWGAAHGVGAGDAVALMMSNCAEYVAIWLGLTRVGAVVALINSQLAGDVLAHSINIVHPKALLIGADLAPAGRRHPRAAAGRLAVCSPWIEQRELHAAGSGTCQDFG